IMDNIKEKVDEKLKLIDTELNISTPIEFNYEELVYFVKNHKNLFSSVQINLKITENDLNDDLLEFLSNNVTMIDKQNIDTVDIHGLVVEFEDITRLDTEKAEKLDEILSASVSWYYSDEKAKYKSKFAETYEKDLETVKAEQEAFKELTDGISDDMSDIDKFKIVYTRIAEKVSYDHEYYAHHNAYKIQGKYDPTQNLEGILTEKSVCSGYSVILAQALKLVNIEANTRQGKAPLGDLHAWNQVKIDGEWYNTDLTADSSNLGNIYTNPYCCLRSDEVFARQGYSDGGSLDFLQYEERRSCLHDYPQEELQDYFHEYTMKKWEKQSVLEEQKDGQEQPKQLENEDLLSSAIQATEEDTRTGIINKMSGKIKNLIKNVFLKKDKQNDERI
ncbi:MAG: hypothetical protein K6B70_07195, partial [Clostridia bacterium]|nr:hypothetical protein [Clostridia bacterium]